MWFKRTAQSVRIYWPSWLAAVFILLPIALPYFNAGAIPAVLETESPLGVKSEERPAGERDFVELGYVEFPPFTYTQPDGGAAGIFLDLGRQALEKSGLKYRLRSYPAGRFFRNLSLGYSDVFMGIKGIPVLKETTIAGTKQIGVIEMRLYYKSEFPALKTKKQLRNKSVIIMQGYGYSGWAKFIRDRKNNIQYITADSHESAFEMLKRNRADYLIDYKLPAQKALQSIQVQGLTFNVLKVTPIYYIISKKSQRSRRLLKMLEKHS